MYINLFLFSFLKIRYIKELLEVFLFVRSFLLNKWMSAAVFQQAEFILHSDMKEFYLFLLVNY
ncbi:hypothetical protein BBV17_07375 [Cytobacillus oceanisediminis]|uniref:Uncharacterized protein n=1 Tax=Cytobacillus oceanisediminis TaxID=665099 RepID=A0ABX3D0K0_9BACI|nr:hypothetical protein BBV17_07375 [Cytobacillus oceanisediminis]